MTRSRRPLLRRVLVVGAVLTMLLAGSAVEVTSSTSEMETGEFAFLMPSGPASRTRVAKSAVNGDGRTIVSGRRAFGRPAWSPDGNRIAFSAPLPPGSLGRHAIYVMNGDGSGLRRVTTPRYGDFDPAWSPDGTRLAFVRDTRGTTRDRDCCQLRIVSADGGASSAVPRANGKFPTWSPDGSWLAFEHLNGLRIVRPDGSGMRTIVPGDVTQPAWSPDGSTIAFVRQLSADRSRLDTVPAEGGTVQTRVDPGEQVESPQWAEDSSTLYLVRFRGRGYQGREASSIWRADAGGSLSLMADPPGQVHHLSYAVDPTGPPSTDYRSIPFQVGGEYVPLVGDFDGTSPRGSEDVVWYAPGSGTDYRWDVTIRDGSLSRSQRVISVGGDYEPFVADFDRDGADDIFWYAPGPANDYVWFGGSSFSSQSITVNGDYDPVPTFVDGQPAIYWYSSDGTDHLWLANQDRTFTTQPAHPAGSGYRPAPIAGADGRPGILWYKPGSGFDYVWSGVNAGESPDSSEVVSIGGDYEPVAQYPYVLLYAEGQAVDYFVGYGLDGSGWGSRHFRVNGSYVPAGSHPAGAVVWHAPGNASDYYWSIQP